MKQSNQHQIARLTWQGIAYQSCNWANKHKPEPEKKYKHEPKNDLKLKLSPKIKLDLKTYAITARLR